jgi:hypothetical protein
MVATPFTWPLDGGVVFLVLGWCALIGLAIGVPFLVKLARERRARLKREAKLAWRKARATKLLSRQLRMEAKRQRRLEAVATASSPGSRTLHFSAVVIRRERMIKTVDETGTNGAAERTRTSTGFPASTSS